MKNLLLGLVVLGALLGGVFLARTRVEPATTRPVANAGADDAIPDADEAIPDVTHADATVEAGGVRVTLSATPHPPVAFAKNRFRVRVDFASDRSPANRASTAPATLEGGRISFEMTMPMGDHRYSLVPADDGWQEAEVVLPMCQSGNPRWYATVEGAVAGRPAIARFRLDLAKR